ncbi:MAG: class I SAM-dependent methyltransferase, partial [Ardenticatenales bacterium]|nr:class I SAM-dependent methyltransferase [Ardenticatenales bacterium]
MTDTSLRDSYDETPFLKQTYVHVDGMATIAALQGLRPAPVAACRVLELGCGSGSNLIAMAYGLPESRFLGIDLSAQQSADGQATVAELGLPNVEIRQGDILAVDDSFGPFDYIIAHGVYSWVPPVVREKVLSICRERLAPQGIAYVSYNVFPGWHPLLIIREMLRYHTRDLCHPLER